jgi:predicted TIM-barrel fold metal-dependent hydrolase
MSAPWNTDAPLENYFRRARAAGVTRTVVVPAGHSDYGGANAQLARIVARHPERLIGFAAVHATRDAGRVFEMVKQAVSRWGFRGLKVHGYDALPTREVCEAVRAFRIPMLVDVVGRAYIIDLLAPQFREVDFIIPHLGSFLQERPRRSVSTKKLH